MSRKFIENEYYAYYIFKKWFLLIKQKLINLTKTTLLWKTIYHFLSIKNLSLLSVLLFFNK